MEMCAIGAENFKLAEVMCMMKKDKDASLLQQQTLLKSWLSG